MEDSLNKYNLENLRGGNCQSIIKYVKECMKDKKLGNIEIKEYELEAKKSNYYELLNLSQEYIDMLNKM